MKKVFLVLLCLSVAGVIGCAKVEEAEAKGGDPCKSFLGSVLNKCVEHPKEKDTWIYGVGVDVPLWKAEKLIVDQETRLELNNGVNSDGIATYTVFKPQMKRGLFQIVGDWISNLINRG
jgi:hypothetical protein